MSKGRKIDKDKDAEKVRVEKRREKENCLVIIVCAHYSDQHQKRAERVKE